MTRYFIVGIDPITKEQSQIFQDWIKEKRLGWWHWIDSVWLLVSSNPDINASVIRDQLCTAASGATNLVVEIDPITWSGSGPKSKERNMFKWLVKELRK